MTQYFSIPRIDEACLRLRDFNSKWVLVPFVMACNGVDSQGYTTLGEHLGTDPLLRRFMNGDLIGLPPLDAGRPHHIRPAFKELRRGKQDGPFAQDRIIRGRGQIYGNNYTQLVNAAPVTYGLERRPNDTDGWKLAADFGVRFGPALTGFHFEDFLVWLYAFSGFDDAIHDWSALLTAFCTEHTATGSFPVEYHSHFSIPATPLPWPSDILTTRPTNADLQAALIPSALQAPAIGPQPPQSPTPIEGPLTREDWNLILEELSTLVTGQFVGLEPGEANSLAREVIVGLATTKRVFLLGDPGTGKSEFAALVEEAFRAHLGERLRAIPAEVTDKTSETTLMGFPGLDGEWVHGRLTAPDQDGSLLLLKNPPSTDSDPSDTQAPQVNLITLNEANRRDVEALLALIQASLDSASRDPLNRSHEVRLGRSGTYMLPPDTYVVMTG